MCRVILTIGFIFTLVFSIEAQKRGGRGFDRGFEIWENAKNPDYDKDYEVDTTELRKWVGAITTLYNDGRARRFDQKGGLERLNAYDEDKDEKLSSKESRAFRDDMKELFEKAAKKILQENDENKNRRLDKSELVKVREKIDNFLVYALSLKDAEPEPEVAKKEEKSPEKKKYSIHDIYN